MLGIINADDNYSLKFTFEGFSQYPRIQWDNPEIWESTKDIDVPWGELDVGNVIFTLPTGKLKEIDNVPAIQKMFDLITQEISSFMAYSLDIPYRVIFDIQLSGPEPNSSYPLVFLMDSIDEIFHNNKPTKGLFSAVTYMGILSIKEETVDSTTEMALATLCSASIFQKIFPDFDPISFLGDSAPKLFLQLWEIHTNFDKNLLPKVLQKFQDDTAGSSDSEDMWINFVKGVCEIGDRNFTKLLEHAKPIPLNILRSFSGLKEYDTL